MKYFVYLSSRINSENDVSRPSSRQVYVLGRTRPYSLGQSLANHGLQSSRKHESANLSTELDLKSVAKKNDISLEIKRKTANANRYYLVLKKQLSPRFENQDMHLKVAYITWFITWHRDQDDDNFRWARIRPFRDNSFNFKLIFMICTILIFILVMTRH